MSDTELCHKACADELARLTVLLGEVLLAADGDLGEHELFGILAARGERRFNRERDPSSHALFCAHFLLFHALYELRRKWRRKKQRDLAIGCLAIGVRPLLEEPATALGELDPLAAYYLELENLWRTTEAEVERMLDDFWRTFSRQGERARALRALGLAEDADEATIKRRYRRLAFACHPDRGGDHEELVRLNAAMEALGRGSLFSY